MTETNNQQMPQQGTAYGQNPSMSGNQQPYQTTQSGNANPQYAGQYSQDAYAQNMYAQNPNFGQMPNNGYQFQPSQGTYTQSSQAQNTRPPFGPATGGEPNDHGQELKHDGNMFQNGQFLEVLDGIMKGSPDMEKISGLIKSTDTQFWKGAAVGAGAAFILGNPTVQKAIGNFFSSFINKENKK